MTLTAVIVIAATVTLGAVGTVAAADVTVASGQRVRILAPAVTKRPIVGELVASDDGTLTVVSREGGLLILGWPFSQAGAKTLRLPRESEDPKRVRVGFNRTRGGGVGVGLSLSF